MEKALDQFVRRVVYGNTIKKLDIQGTHAGSPVYSYCKHCGIPTETFPEPQIYPLLDVCSQCTFLEKENLLDKAKEVASKL